MKVNVFGGVSVGVRIILNHITPVFIAMLLCLSPVAWSQTNFYVSPKGNDAHNGSIKSPWKTFRRAIEGVRDYRAQHPEQAVNVLFADGIYHLDHTLKFGKEDSGTSEAPIVYKAMKDAKPILSGSISLNSWKKVNDKRILSEFPKERKEDIYVCQLPKKIDLQNTVPVKTGCPPISNQNKRIVKARVDLICNDEFQTLARYPNKGFMRTGQVLSQPDEKHSDADVKFSFHDQRITGWENEEVYLGGYWQWDWSDEFQQVANIQMADSTMTLSGPIHRYGYKEKAPFWGVNLFCELDSVSEYYIDRKKGKVYWCPDSLVDLKHSHISLTCFADPYMVEFDECSYIELDGLTFRDGCTVGVKVNGGNDIRIASCRFFCFSESALHVFGGTNHQITGCLMKEFGERVIHVESGDRKKLIPANHCIDNNIIQDFSIMKRTYEPAIYFKGVGLRIVNNFISNCPSSAIRIDGNDVTVEFNEFVDLIKESDDQGVIDMWKDLSCQGIRICHNYFQDIKGGTKQGSAAVRFDDMISGALVYGNIFNRVGFKKFGAVQIHGGKENMVTNNLFYDCRAAVSFNPWTEERWMEAVESDLLKKKHYEDVDISSEIYRKKYPILNDIHSNLNRNMISHNLLVNCSTMFLGEENVNKLDENCQIDRTKHDIDYFYQPDILKKYGLEALERDKMGVKNNKWK